MRVLFAFDKFKDAVTAPAACEIAAAALKDVQPTWETEICPLTDGGEGFADILTRAAHGQFKPVVVCGPRGKPTDVNYGIVALRQIPEAARSRLALPTQLGPDARVAIIEMAAASGLALLRPEERDPWHASTWGTGQIIRDAVDQGAQAIVIGVGGSATNDLGLGMLAVLGLRFSSADGGLFLTPEPRFWSAIAQCSGQLPSTLPPIRVACDVTNPVLGPLGCATVYGPQKGLKAQDLARMEEQSGRLARLLCAHYGRPESIMDTPGAGAAGGIAFGLIAAAKAQLVSGFGLTSDWVGLPERLAWADVVVTGEGRFDASSDQGKGPGAVVAAALAAGKRTLVLAGQVSDAVRSAATLHAISPKNMPLSEALPRTPVLLRDAIHHHFRRSP